MLNVAFVLYIMMYINFVDYWKPAAVATLGVIIMLWSVYSLGAAVGLGLLALVAVWLGVSVYHVCTKAPWRG